MPIKNELANVRDTYGRVAARYADAFVDELAGKAADRELLDKLVAEVKGRGGGAVADLGTGSGQVARYLHDKGVDVTGIDVAPAMIREARIRHPAVKFAVGDLLRLEVDSGAYAAVTAFYAFVHLDARELGHAFDELARVLAPGGVALLAWHLGDETVKLEEFLGAPCTLGWNYFPMATVIAAAETAGLTAEQRLERPPYEGEHAGTSRGYLFVRKA